MLKADRQSAFPPPGFSLLPLSRAELSGLEALCDRCVGAGLYSRAALETLLKSENCFCNLLQDAYGTLVGYNFNYILPTQALSEELHLSREQLARLRIGNCAGVLRSIGILDEYRGHGLAQGLLQYGVHQLTQHDASLQFGVAWRQGERVPMAHILERLGFAYLWDIPQAWQQAQELICPVCGRQPCICSAALYWNGEGEQP